MEVYQVNNYGFGFLTVSVEAPNPLGTSGKLNIIS